MELIERGIVTLLLNVVEPDAINELFRSPQVTAIVVGVCVAVAGALLGSFLVLRGMALTSDAISHTVLLGIVVAFIIMVGMDGVEPDLSSPWLMIGAAAAGVATVVLTDMIHRSGLVKQDAALGLAFPFLFAVAVMLVAGAVDDVHLDEDAVMVGEIGVAWANTNSHCFGDCETVVIDKDDPRAELTRRCTNCGDLGISPRDERAEFETICTNCRTYTPAQAWREGFLEERPLLVFWPKSLTVTGMMALIAVVFVLVFFKEIKVGSFDAGLAHALGFRPTLLTYLLMVLVSLVAVAAFDAVGSVLVIAFFIIPPAAAYLMTDRLGLMLPIAAGVGGLSAAVGYDFARGRLFGLTILPGWNTSISASMVLAMFGFFLICWMASPQHGLVAAVLQRRRSRRLFEEQILLGHVFHHAGSDAEKRELSAAGMDQHMHWPKERLDRVLRRLRVRDLVRDHKGLILPTDSGAATVQDFRRRYLRGPSG